MNAREFLTKWNFEIEHEKLEKLEKNLESIKERLDFLTAVEVAKGLFEMVEKFGKMAEALHLTSESTGIAVEELQKLSFSAEQAGISAGTVETSMFRLSRALYQAKAGTGQAAENFRKIGISHEQIMGFHNAKDAMMAVADRMKHVANASDRAALAQSFFGRGARQMPGWLAQGSAAIKKQGEDFEKLGAVLSEKKIAALVEAEHSFLRFWAVIKGISGTVAADFSPVIVKMVEDFQNLFLANKEVIQGNLENWLNQVAFGMGVMVGAVEVLVDWLMRLAKYLGIEKHLLPWLATLASVVSGILLFKGAMMVLGPVIGAVFGPIGTAAGVLKYLGFNFYSLGRAAGRLYGLLTTLSSAFMSIATYAASGIIPFLLVAAAIAALVVVGHDLYAVFFQGKDFRETWIGQALHYVEELIEKVTGLKNIFGIGDKDQKRLNDQELSPGAGVLQGLSDTQKLGNSFVPNISGNPAFGNTPLMPDFGSGVLAAGPSNNSIMAPVTINVGHGTNPADVGKHVENGIKDHLDGVYRQTDRSLRPAVAH